MLILFYIVHIQNLGGKLKWGEREEIKKMKSYRCCKCGTVFTGWAVGKICQKCGGKLELITEDK